MGEEFIVSNIEEMCDLMRENTYKRRKNTMYYLTTTAKRKNAKRHIVIKSNDLEYLRRIGKDDINDCYITEIYDGKWNLVERIK